MAGWRGCERRERPWAVCVRCSEEEACVRWKPEGNRRPPETYSLRGSQHCQTALGIAGCWGPSHSPLPTHCRPASSWHHVQNSNTLKAVLVGFSREQRLQQLQRVACDYGSPLHSEYSWQTLQRTWMQVWPGKAQLSSRYLDKKSDLKSLSKRKTQNTCG